MGSVLSIVVPIYNVAPYLDECLSSIAGQTRAEIEVVLVDDGSTDESPSIAAGWAGRDPRFKLVSKANAGLGAARNTGVEHATGEFLMFVDSDDVLPPYAAEVLVGTLEKTGSDFSCGNVLRLTGKGLHQSGMHRAPFAETALKTHVTKLPVLLGDRTAWNKVYRRDFYDRHGLVFPEGVLYEDAAVTVPAHGLATAVDVLDVPVYYWREREGESRSITQRREELPQFIDRLDSCWTVSKLLGTQHHDDIKRKYDDSVLQNDLMLFMKVLPVVDDEYRRVFLDRVNAFLDTIDPRVIDDLPTNLRVLWTLTRHRMLPQMLELIPQVKKNAKIVRRGLKHYHDMDLMHARLPELPAEVFQAGVPRPRTRLHELSWKDGKLHLRGYAFIPGQAAVRPWSTSRLIWLEHNGGARTKRVPLVNRRSPDATADHGTVNTAYDWSGFDAVIDPRQMRKDDGSWRTGEWAVVIGVVGLGRKSKGTLGLGRGPGGLALPAYQVDGDVRITPFVERGRLRLRIEKINARITGGRRDGDDVVIEGDIKPTPAMGQPDAKITARLSRVAGLHWGRYPVTVEGPRFSFRIPADALSAPGTDYPQLRIGEPTDRFHIDLTVNSKRYADSGAGKRNTKVGVTVAGHLDFPPLDLGGRTVHLHADRERHPALALLPSGPVLTAVSTAARQYRLEGVLPAGDWSGLHLVLRLTNGRETRAFPASVDGDRFTVEFDPDAVELFGAHIRMRGGTWNVLYRLGTGEVRPLPVSAGFLTSLPLPLAGDAPRISMEWMEHERAVMRIRSAIAEDERGKSNGWKLRTEYYPDMRERPLRDVVLYNSFTGRQYSDSPRAVHEELVARGLPLTHQWVSADGQAPVPATAEMVPLWSRRWYESLATSRYIVTNQHLPEWFRRREGQVVVQTWHGTPLKRIGLDIADVQFTDTRYLEKLAVEAPNWSHLVSPNRFSTPILKRAFGYPGDPLEIGYPRNDLLFRDRDEVIAKVRAAVGLPAGKKIVVYAPTWRDDEFAGGGYRISMKIDVADAAAKLGHDHVLLVRRHPNVLDEIPGVGDGFVYDVGAYPDMAELMAAADVLITDYSSVMFDFANTGRPLLFFTYDLAHYRDVLRGFYFDFEAEAPGPLLSTSEEVVAAIRDVDVVAAEYTERYAAFRARACDLDDGHASARLVETMLEAGNR